MRRTCRTALLAAIGAALLVSGCGAADRENDPRPPSPIELTAKIDNDKVIVSPSEAGGGLATITISNQSDQDVALTFAGPSEGSTQPIAAGNVGALKIDLQEGDYDVSADDPSLKPTTLTVGPERPSAQNDLLLP